MTSTQRTNIVFKEGTTDFSTGSRVAVNRKMIANPWETSRARMPKHGITKD